ncbi:hypothetical protein CASFOL_040765 [Castilleja foliolosa]|uniref:Protein E6-like n=1 Tax=Castilleja foliolosa TaxID=1961234 RepID=A0ABD3BCX1_9LAMI
MALFAKQFSLFLLFISLLSSHARESQYFNKNPANTNNDVVSFNKKPESNPKQQQQPDFLPDNEKGHGLYGQDSGRLPNPSTTGTADPYKTVPNQYLPKNYNPVSYVSQLDDLNIDSDSDDKFAGKPEGKNKFDGGADSYFITSEEKEPEYRNNYYNGGSSFNSGRRDKTFSNGGAGAKPQGMSDTRALANGKYYYDIEAEKYNNNHPYENMKRSNARNVYGFVNGGKNSMGGYQKQEQEQYEFQEDEENNNNWRP